MIKTTALKATGGKVAPMSWASQLAASLRFTSAAPSICKRASNRPTDILPGTISWYTFNSSTCWWLIWRHTAVQKKTQTCYLITFPCCIFLIFSFHSLAKLCIFLFFFCLPCQSCRLRPSAVFSITKYRQLQFPALFLCPLCLSAPRRKLSGAQYVAALTTQLSGIKPIVFL